MTTQSSSEREHRIVVGVDGSEPSKAALAWAVGQARRTGAVVEPVIAWEFPANYGYPVPVAPSVDFAELAKEVLDLAIADAPGKDEVTFSPRVAEGNPAQILLLASEGADLLVVGSRGHGGFMGSLLGSVSQHCVHHASCPVVVIRNAADGA